MPKSQKTLVTQYVRMWPREVFDRLDAIGESQRKKLMVKGLDVLSNPGVYVLYRDDQPYYVGRAQKMRSRIWSHANRPASKHYHFWNFFSAFVVPTQGQAELEGILIAAMPTANGANPKLPREKMPKEVRDLLREMRRNRVKR
jgi:hypothetical protein